MFNAITHSQIYVLDQDEALDFYVGKLGLEVNADVDLGFMRWLTVNVPGHPERQILLEKSEEFERLARGLLEYETLTGEEIGKVIRGEPLGGDDDTPSSAIPAVPAVPRIPPASGGPAPVPTA